MSLDFALIVDVVVGGVIAGIHSILEPMSFEVGVIFLIAIGFIGLYFALRHLLQQRSQTDSIESIVEQVFGRSASLVAQQSRDILKGEKVVTFSKVKKN